MTYIYMADILFFNDHDSKIVFYILELKLVFKMVLINKLYVIIFIEMSGLSSKKPVSNCGFSSDLCKVRI